MGQLLFLYTAAHQGSRHWGKARFLIETGEVADPNQAADSDADLLLDEGAVSQRLRKRSILNAKRSCPMGQLLLFYPATGQHGG
jgi:hypothetical protein